MVTKNIRNQKNKRKDLTDDSQPRFIEPATPIQTPTIEPLQIQPPPIQPPPIQPPPIQPPPTKSQPFQEGPNKSHVFTNQTYSKKQIPFKRNIEDNIIKGIRKCLNNLNKRILSQEVIDNLDGEEIDSLLFSDTLRFHARLSTVTRPAETRASRKNMMSRSDHDTLFSSCQFNDIHKFVFTFNGYLKHLTLNQY